MGFLKLGATALLGGWMLLWFAQSAQAVSLTIRSDKTSYLVGETIRLDVVGDPMGLVAYGIYGRLTYDANLTETIAASQVAQTKISGDGTWLAGPTDFADGSAGVLNQIVDPADSSSSTHASATLIAEATGLVAVNWIIGTGGAHLEYFGLRAAPGTSFIITPEPHSGSLLGLALATLSASRRRRACSRPCSPS